MKAKYANKITVSTSLYETRMEFGIESPNDNDDNDIKKIADIRISPQLAKKLRDILSQSIDSYEKSAGKIPSDSVETEKG